MTEQEHEMIKDIKFSKSSRTMATYFDDKPDYFVIEIYTVFSKMPVVIHLSTDMELKQVALRLMTAVQALLGGDQ